MLLKLINITPLYDFSFNLLSYSTSMDARSQRNRQKLQSREFVEEVSLAQFHPIGSESIF